MKNSNRQAGESLVFMKLNLVKNTDSKCEKTKIMLASVRVSDKSSEIWCGGALTSGDYEIKAQINSLKCKRRCCYFRNHGCVSVCVCYVLGRFVTLRRKIIL